MTNTQSDKPRRDTAAAEEELFRHVIDLYEIGRKGRYGYRMPGTEADHEGARYVAAELRRLGLSDVVMEPVPVALALPETWSFAVKEGSVIRSVACSFVRYAGYTPSQGMTAELVHVGRGSPAEFEAANVRGKIVLVDIVPIPALPNLGPRYFSYDPHDTSSSDLADLAWPLLNMNSSYQEAVKRGAVGWVGALEAFGDDTSEYHHLYFRYELPAVTISAVDGRILKEQLRSPMTATLTLTGSRGQGVSYNVYGVVRGRRSDECIVVKTHHDGWATNEASGTAVALGVAKRMTAADAPKLDRTLVFFFRASHFGIGWTITPDDMHISVSDATRIFGLNAGWDSFSSRARDLLPNTVVVNNIEMIGAQYRSGADRRWFKADVPAVRYWGVTGPEGGANPILLKAVQQVIVSNDLDRSHISNFMIGDGMTYSDLGVPVVNLISHNAFQFTRKDTPETVMKEDLPKLVEAFVELVQAEDVASAEALHPVAPFALNLP